MQPVSKSPRDELRIFLRSARARLDPADAGIAMPARRHSKTGLRIEELCAISGVGITWYRALESGKPVNASRRLLASIAGALRLSDDERHYFYGLAEYEEPAGSPNDGSMRETLVRLVDTIDVGPAMLIGERWEILAANCLAETVYGASLQHKEHNFAERMFLDAEFRALHLDWDMNARKLVGALKMNYAFARDRNGFDRFVRALRKSSPEFAALWDELAIEEHRPKIARLDHPSLGRLTFEFIGLQQAERWRGFAEDTVLVQVPVPHTGTREALLKVSAG